MEGNFNDFSEIPNADVESTDKVNDKPEDSKIVGDCLNKVIKELHKQNKLLRKVYRRSKHTVAKKEPDVEEPVAEEPPVEKASTASRKNCSTNTTAKKSERSFLERLGDAFLKALPSILRTIATVAVPLLFGCISRRRGNYREVVT